MQPQREQYNPCQFGKTDEALLWGNSNPSGPADSIQNCVSSEYIPQPVGPPKQSNGQSNANYLDQMQLHIQQQIQRQKFQAEQHYKAANEVSSTDLNMGFQPQVGSQQQYMSNPTAALSLNLPERTKSKDDNSSVSSGKKKKDRKKKKKKRHSSSSSSSSSSDSSGSGRGRRSVRYFNIIFK